MEYSRIIKNARAAADAAMKAAEASQECVNRLLQKDEEAERLG